MKDGDVLLLLVLGIGAVWLWRNHERQQAAAGPPVNPLLGVPPALPPPSTTATLSLQRSGAGHFGAPTSAPTSSGGPSKLDKVQAVFQAGAQASLQAAGVPSALAKPIAKYANTIADARYVAKGATVAAKGVAKAATAIGSATSSAAHAVGSTVSKAFSWL